MILNSNDDFWLISDTHFGHLNILQFEKRPFKSVSEMDAGMIKAWNDVVGDNDTVVFLGDFTLKGSRYIRPILEQLKGRKIFIGGNHDKDHVYERLADEGMIEEYIHVGTVVKVKKQRFYLSHFPMEIGERNLLYNLHGHIHSEESRYRNQFNVGVDSKFMHAYYDENSLPFGTPIKFSKVIEKLSK